MYIYNIFDLSLVSYFCNIYGRELNIIFRDRADSRNQIFNQTHRVRAFVVL